MPNSRAISIIPLTVVMLALLLWVAHREAEKLVRETLAPNFSAINDHQNQKESLLRLPVATGAAIE